MKSHVRIEQLVSDMNNARMRDPFQSKRTPVRVSPSGESHLLDDVFNDDEECVKELFNDGVFNKKYIPKDKDTS
jgi:hypothetical protein